MRLVRVPPPPTNRGAVNTSSPEGNHSSAADGLTVSCHWLTATSKEVSSIDAVSFISEYLGHGPEIRDSGLMGYTSTFAWAGGLKLLDNDDRPEMGVCLVADGTACEFYGFSKLSHIYQALQLTATRFDLAVDGLPFHPLELRRYWYSDNVRTACKTMDDAKPGLEKVRTCQWFSSPNGDTFYMGSRSSTQFARCYNSRETPRFEMELKKERAVQVIEALNAGASMASVAGSVIRQFVAFVNLDDENRSRCSLLPFWAEFLDMLDDAGVVTRLDPKPEPTIDRLKEWIETQVAPSLYVYETLWSSRDDFSDVRRDLRRIGLAAAKPKHHALIQAGGGWLNYHDPVTYRAPQS